MKLWARAVVALLVGSALPAIRPGTSWGVAPPAGITITGVTGTATILTPAQLSALPDVTETVSFGTDHGAFKASFSGPLLWAVLQAGGNVGGKMSKAVVREYALVTGADGYEAIVALGEVSPAFENKEVILATQMNGKALGARA